MNQNLDLHKHTHTHTKSSGKSILSTPLATALINAPSVSQSIKHQRVFLSTRALNRTGKQSSSYSAVILAPSIITKSG